LTGASSGSKKLELHVHTNGNIGVIVEVNCEPTGKFAHDPEPLPENLAELAKAVDNADAHVGFAVDPDVDRLAIVNEDGSMFGEEYTLVAVADYVLRNKTGNTVSNLSSTQALKEVTEKHGGSYHSSAVGEVNVVEKMKEVDAVIGGEGNGGIIYPELHYGRDALVGVALFLSHLAQYGKSCSRLRATYPNFHIAKNKIQLDGATNLDKVFAGIKRKYSNKPINETDGLKIMFDNDWVHLRKSNTEPIIRIYAESESENASNSLTSKIIQDIREVMKEMG
jgi:phosphomannomutase